MNCPILAYNETSLPSPSLKDKFDLARRYNLALEVANCGNFPVLSYQQSGLKIAAVQAYQMHDFHPLHPDLENRQIALQCVLETLEIAAILNASRIVTVCGFGQNIVDKPEERCEEFFQKVGDRAAELGIKIAIEPLSPKRVAKFNSPAEVVKLIQKLNRPNIFYLLLDTGHLADSGIDVNNFFLNMKYSVLELQLKGLNSTPPPIDIPLKLWLDSLPTTPEVICVEHRQAIDLIQFHNLIDSLQQILYP